jgi:hypothetical protein
VGELVIQGRRTGLDAHRLTYRFGYLFSGMQEVHSLTSGVRTLCTGASGGKTRSRGAGAFHIVSD